MSIENAYNSWASSYDEMQNKTRDLEALVAKEMLGDSHYTSILELGCGTGKNTQFLLEVGESIIAFDFSKEMLEKAKQKISSEKVTFKEQDLSHDWGLEANSFDLICCSLVLEHLEEINSIFEKSTNVLKANGKFYVSELHPFKQYSGSKARFDNGKEIEELEVYTHHISDYLIAAKECGLKLIELKESFDDDNKSKIPRLISFLFQK